MTWEEFFSQSNKKNIYFLFAVYCRSEKKKLSNILWRYRQANNMDVLTIKFSF